MLLEVGGRRNQSHRFSCIVEPSVLLPIAVNSAALKTYLVAAAEASRYDSASERMAAHLASFRTEPTHSESYELTTDQENFITLVRGDVTRLVDQCGLGCSEAEATAARDMWDNVYVACVAFRAWRRMTTDDTNTVLALATQQRLDGIAGAHEEGSFWTYPRIAWHFDQLYGILVREAVYFAKTVDIEILNEAKQSIKDVFEKKGYRVPPDDQVDALLNGPVLENAKDRLKASLPQTFPDTEGVLKGPNASVVKPGDWEARVCRTRALEVYATLPTIYTIKDVELKRNFLTGPAEPRPLDLTIQALDAWGAFNSEELEIRGDSPPSLAEAVGFRWKPPPEEENERRSVAFMEKMFATEWQPVMKAMIQREANRDAGVGGRSDPQPLLAMLPLTHTAFVEWLRHFSTDGDRQALRSLMSFAGRVRWSNEGVGAAARTEHCIRLLDTIFRTLGSEIVLGLTMWSRKTGIDWMTNESVEATKRQWMVNGWADLSLGCRRNPCQHLLEDGGLDVHGGVLSPQRRG
eukprot:Polyplicarium_translucidae@DN527_c0_g1_i1.p1